MRIYNLSKSAREDFSSKLEVAFAGARLQVKDLKIAELDDANLAVIFESEQKLYVGIKKGTFYFPLLKDEVLLTRLASAVVDMGAVKFVINGANIMRPGIVSFDRDFRKDDLLVVREVGHHKAIAVGKSLEERKVLEELKRGAAIQNIHYVGDKFWEALKSIETMR